MDTNKTIVCLKWGTKYSPQYVNVLFNMCKRHMKSSFDFVCLTDNPSDLNPGIIVKTLPRLALQGWWVKPYVFSADNKFSGDVLFLDLDVIIYDNLDKLWTHKGSDFFIIRDFTRVMNPKWQKFNSSVFLFKPKNYYWIWEDFSENHKNITTKLHGDQDYLYNILKQKAAYWPDDWIQSYKWEMRDRADLGVINGRRNFKNIKSPKLSSNGCIAVFHGDPNPHEVQDPWVIENWK